VCLEVRKLRLGGQIRVGGVVEVFRPLNVTLRFYLRITCGLLPTLGNNRNQPVDFIERNGGLRWTLCGTYQTDFTEDRLSEPDLQRTRGETQKQLITNAVLVFLLLFVLLDKSMFEFLHFLYQPSQNLALLLSWMHTGL